MNNDIEKLRDLIDKYWDAAWREGRENRMHDDRAGTAMAVRHEIESILSSIEAARAHQAGSGEAVAWLVARPSPWKPKVFLSNSDALRFSDSRHDASKPMPLIHPSASVRMDAKSSSPTLNGVGPSTRTMHACLTACLAK